MFIIIVNQVLTLLVKIYLFYPGTRAQNFVQPVGSNFQLYHDHQYILVELPKLQKKFSKATETFVGILL